VSARDERGGEPSASSAEPLQAQSAGDLLRYIDAMDTSLSDRTKQEYVGILKEIPRKLASDADALTPDMVFTHLQAVLTEKRLARSTFRIYKAAAMYWLAQQAQAVIDSGGDHSEYARVFAAVHSLNAHALPAKTARTSSRKLKLFSQESLQSLQRYAQTRGSRAPNASRAVAFCEANLLVGLRPGEWFDTTFASYLERDERGELVRDPHGLLRFTVMLVVENAKATHGRGNGQRRELLLYGISAGELKSLVLWREIAIAFKDRHPGVTRKQLTSLLYRPLNNTLRRALLAAGHAAADIPACYSTRHQAVADQKASDVPPRVIAAFFGHSSEYTHRAHYGQRRHGARKTQFRPSPQSLSRVAASKTPRAPEGLSTRLAAQLESWTSEQALRKSPDPPG
jgi:hypothetical protein